MPLPTIRRQNEGNYIMHLIIFNLDLDKGAPLWRERGKRVKRVKSGILQKPNIQTFNLEIFGFMGEEESLSIGLAR